MANPSVQGPSFQGTGPQGHRGRMRTRLLANPGALADYEVLEMLLFLGIPRRDTKPLAKALIHRFGSLAAALTAPGPSLRDAGLLQPALAPLGMAAEAAAALARPERKDMPLLADLDALDRHLQLGHPRPAGLAAVLLDSRNRLLAHCTWPADTTDDAFVREMLRDALARHAAAVILVHDRPDAACAPAAADRALLAAAREAGGALSVVVHDLVLTGRDGWTSLRQPRG